ncbi:probable glycosyltransferase STELLO1 isoform X2 [Haliotis rufescens]|uniref:probable glycosyltransferase STELLO1 isoform X2 n=1 Tax=Haliotis rufescens TaxID=6454 RepID=UPI00201EC04B|nr:probable glycosyltransferase STELLO1 isoform X2 [Haliotis rufescens]
MHDSFRWMYIGEDNLDLVKNVFTMRMRLLFLGLLVASTIFLAVMLHRNYRTFFHDSNPARPSVNRRITRNSNWGGRWIVLSLDSAYQTDVSYLDDVIGWNIVVSGPQPYLDGCRKPKCTYIHPGNIQTLPFTSVKHAGEKGYPLKNIAYLYAMSQSAEVIYDLAYGVKPILPMNNFIYSDHTHGLIYTGNTTFNHYRHFGQPYLHPVGFPESVNATQSKLFDLCYVPTPPIQHGIISGETPLYHDQRKQLLKISREKTLDLQFDTMAPPAFVPPGRFSAVTTGNTLFTRKAFWLMLLPFSGDSVLDGVVRGYLSQRLMWETGDYTGHMGTTAIRNINPKFKKLVLNNIKILMKELEKWRCDSSENLLGCFNSLVRSIVAKAIISKANIAAMESWINDLRIMNLLRDNPRMGFSNSKHYSGGQNCTKMHFAPSQHNHKIYNLTSMSVVVQLPWDNKPICPEVDEVKEALRSRAPAKYLFTDVLLIVEINYPKLYWTTWIVESVYRRYFPNILFCGPSMGAFLRFSNKKMSHLEGLLDGWHFMYDCVSYAMKMNYRVKGYLHIGDDTLLQIWNLHKLPRDNAWFNSKLNAFNRTVLITPWYWWKDAEGRHNYEKVLHELKEISQRGTGDAELANRFYTTYIRNRKSLDLMFGSTCDFYYLPQRLKDMFLFLVSLLKKHRVIVEMGIPTILQGMDTLEDIEYIPGKLIFGEDRYRFQELFTSDDYFFHPMKFGRFLNTDDGRRFFCENLQPLFEGSVQFPVRKPDGHP